ncbi:MAG: hypothetical protein AB7O67_03685 [Vicinamibacterales bacterium]
MTTRVSVGTLLLALACGPVAAQPAPGSPGTRGDRPELRHQVYVMEGALARAVEFGAASLNREIRSVMPDVMVLAGRSQARGFYLDGYGVFFDVEVPVLRQSMMWSLRMMLDQDQAGVARALTALREHVKKETDPATRTSLENAIKRLELQVGPIVDVPRAAGATPTGRQVGPAVVLPEQPGQPGRTMASTASAQQPAATPEPAVPMDRVWMEDPNKAYTEAVVRALVDAMIDFSTPMALGPDEWLTVAARDNEQRDTLAPQDPYEEVDTLTLRIRGADLAAYRSGQIDRDEARRRVSVSR